MSRMLTWFINKKKIARPQSTSTPSSRVQLCAGLGELDGISYYAGRAEDGVVKRCDRSSLEPLGSWQTDSGLRWRPADRLTPDLCHISRARLSTGRIFSSAGA